MSEFKNVIIHGDCLDVLKEMPDNSIDAVVTDPPYGLSKEPNIVEVLMKWMNGEDYHHRGGGFMGKTWDSFVPGPSIWKEVYRVLKPGGHALVFAGTRTQDLMTISLRLAGFEIRDVIEWLYTSGFPKSLDVSKAFDKRAGAEREVIGKRTDGRYKYTLRQSGTLRFHGFSSFEELRQAAERGEKCPDGRDARKIYERTLKSVHAMSEITAPSTDLAKKWDGWGSQLKPAHEPVIMARKPLDGSICDNVERWGTGAINIDGCRIGNEERTTKWAGNKGKFVSVENGCRFKKEGETTAKGRFPANCITTEPDMFYSKYFNITPESLSKKASKKDRNSDWRGEPINLDPKPKGAEDGERVDNTKKGPTNMLRPDRSTRSANNHPTVKPTDLMAWLIRLITPPGGIVLDPFCGSGSTLVAAKREGFSFVGIEREKEYVEIAHARVGEPVIEYDDYDEKEGA